MTHAGPPHRRLWSDGYSTTSMGGESTSAPRRCRAARMGPSSYLFPREELLSLLVTTSYPFDETRPGISRAGAGPPRSVATVERQLPKRIPFEKAPDLVELSRLGPSDRREVEQSMLGPLRQQAEDVSQVGPGFHAA
jgi:hypothetical protein